MRTISTVIIGAGQSGLAMSRCLTERSVDHLILERGEAANSWRTERWDSLRLLTPNWQSRLPGDSYRGDDPDGFMTMPEIVARLEGYARGIDAPIRTQTEVLSAKTATEGYRLITTDGEIACRTLVLASGACNLAAEPRIAAEIPRDLFSLHARDYKRPDDLPEGGVLVVGGSATGVQLAEEIHASGRPVTLSVGEHVRAPRSYRGRDIKFWLDAIGALDLRFDQVDDLSRVRRTPSLQLIGSPERRTLDLNALMAAGVEVVGRLADIRDGSALFSGGLANHCALADLKMDRLLDAIDLWARAEGLDAEIEPPQRFEQTRVAAAPRLSLDLRGGGVRSVLWATGYRPDYSWLDIPVLDRRGRLRHQGGIVEAPGLYAMGLPFMRRRKSTLIDGAADDARDLADHMMSQFDRRAA